MRSTRTLLGVTLLFLTLCSTACTALPAQLLKQLPPVSLLIETAAPAAPDRTNGGLVQGIMDLQQALGLCNADKAGVRTWAGE